MRELKFRAWHKLEKKMYDVHGLEWSVDSLFFRERRKALLGESQRCRWHTMYLIDRVGVVAVARGHEVIANDYELMQFTGLTDCNDKEIYEGDVVQITEIYGEKQQAKVFWGPVVADYQWMNGETWLLRFTSGAEGPLYPYCKPKNYYRLEVVGNIWEHPALIGSGV